jgi:hypothetical protein
MGFKLRATPAPEAVATAHQIERIENPHNSSGFQLLRVLITLYSERWGGGAFQNEKLLRLKINCSAAPS